MPSERVLGRPGADADALNALLASWLAGYRVARGAADELLGADGRPREHWLALLGALAKLGEADIDQRFASANRRIDEMGVTYRAPGEARERVAPLARLPLLLPQAEWEAIEAGIVQRAELLDLILRDIYGEGRLIEDGALPATAVTGSPEFIRPMRGVAPAGGRWLRFYAVEIARGPDGAWRVLGDRAQAPSGAGYALENRIVCSRVLPDIFRASHVHRLATFFQTYRETLRSLNLALMEPVWSGQRFVPRGFELRIPASGGGEPDHALASIATVERFNDQKRDAAHRVRRGETLERIAAAYAVQPAELLAFNGLTDPKAVKPGMTLKLPPPKPISAAAAPPGQAAAESASSEVYVVRSGDVLSEIARRFGLSEAALMSQNAISDRNFLFEGQTLNVAKPSAGTASAAIPAEAAVRDEATVEEARPGGESARSKPQPVSSEQAAELGPGLVPGIESAASADPSDYSVSGDSAIVQGAETLGHFADWLSVSASRLRKLNRMPPDSVLALGRHIRLDLSHVDAATFEERRMRYHRQLQDDFFQRYKIVGHERHRLKSGESLWTLTQKTNVPVWLLRQYNPETDFTTVRVGTVIVLPKVESAAAPTLPAAPAATTAPQGAER